MLVSARRIGVPRKTERSDVLWGERLADLFKDKHTPKCHLRFFVDILKLWVIVTLSLSNITSRTKAFTISFRTGYPVYLTKNSVQVTLYLVGVKERVTALFLLLNTEA